jgi:hypothetical protein
MRRYLIALAISAAIASPALAQPGREGPSPVGESGPLDTEKVKQVFVYGDDPCPQGEADEIVVCARMPDNERYRIPKDLRGDPNSPTVQSWVNRARSLETIGASGINSCSPSGAGGFSGCFAQLARKAKEERETTLGSASWADAVKAERDRRLGNLDAESEAIEALARADEAAADADAKAAEDARLRLEAQDQAQKRAEEKAKSGN